MKSIILQRTAMLILAVGCLASSVQAQTTLPKRSEGYWPLNHLAGPGVASQWAGQLGKACPGDMQTIQISGPEGVVISYFDTAAREFTTASGTKVEVQVAAAYRLKISNIPGYPGVELYPTIELIDRTHPPVHLKHEFPVPLIIRQEDIDAALMDDMVTKVIYVDQPDIASTMPALDNRMRSETLPAANNLLAEADMRGRPILIFRMGRRQPNPHQPGSFLVSGGPVHVIGE